MDKWEYKIGYYTMYHENSLHYWLNHQGYEGWELVDVRSEIDGERFLFKRKIQQKKMETTHKIFKPFDKVLVKDIEDGTWKPSFYQFFNEEIGHHAAMSIDYWLDDFEILPYEGNEHLVGTTDEPDEEVNLKGGERIICSDDVKLLMSGVGFLTTFSYVDENIFYTGKSRLVVADYNYAIKFSDFNPNDMEETKKHILCVKSGKVVRYKE